MGGRVRLYSLDCMRQIILTHIAGSITPVEPGRMRNTWYPRQKAAYVTMSTLQGTKPQNIAAERDFTFGMAPKVQPAPSRVEEEKPLDVQPKLLMVSLI